MSNGLNCDHCGAETSNGLALCETCQAGVKVYLEFLPIYFRNLARWKPGRAGGRPVPGSRVPPGVQLDNVVRTGTGDRISDRLDEVNTDMVAWARRLGDDRGVELPSAESHPEQVALICGLLTEHLTSISTTDWCGDLVTSMAANEKGLRELTESYVPGWYAGACQNCGWGTYAVSGLTWVTCANVTCARTTVASAHIDTILEEARGWVARPKALAEAVVALVDTELSIPKVYTRIRQWAFADQITSVYRTERGYAYDVDLGRMVVVDEQVGQARYRLGEVLDRVWAKPVAASATAKAS